MLPQLPSSKLNSQCGRRASDGLCTVSTAGELLAHLPTPHRAGWHQCALGGTPVCINLSRIFYSVLHSPFPAFTGIAFHWLPPTVDFVSSFSMQQENAIGSEARVQRRMSDRPATSMHDILLGQASVKRSLSKLAIP